MRMYTQDAEIIRLGEIYFRFSVITYFFLGLSLVCTIILRCVVSETAIFCLIGAFLPTSDKLCIYFRKTWNATYGNRRSCAGNIDCETV